jgi:hypothetical protein
MQSFLILAIGIAYVAANGYVVFFIPNAPEPEQPRPPASPKGPPQIKVYRVGGASSGASSEVASGNGNRP